MNWFRWRYLLLGLCFSAMHFVLSVVLFGVLFSVGMDRFDTGVPPATWEKYAEFLLGTLHLPFVIIHRMTLIRVPAVIEMGLVCVDSLLWGFAVAWIILRFKRLISASA